MKKICCILFYFIAVYTTAQTYNREHINAKALTQYDKAVEKLADGFIKEAIPDLQKIISIDSNFIDAYLSLAGAYGELKKYDAAIFFYNKAFSKDSIYGKPYLLPYSINLAGAGKFEDALEAVNIFLSVPGLSERSIKSAAYRKRCYAFAVDYQHKHPDNHYVFAPMNLGDSINTANLEYYPSVTIDDSLLVFTKKENGREDFMESSFKNGLYSKAKTIQGDINIEPFKGAISVSADGEWLIFAGNFRNGLGDYDLYISYATPDGWSEPENLGPNVNSGYWDSSPSLSPDNHILYFSSNRPGGYGGADLYMSIRQPNGKWGPAINMGSNFNTIGDEMAPYIHADNQTIYFTSNGLPGYGETDLYISRKDTAGVWSVPENLGYPINTIETEGSMVVAADGMTAYYASDRADSRGGLDLYKFILREDIRPHKTLYVKGKVFDNKTKKGLPCTVELIDNANNSILMHVQTDELGKYFVPLPSGKSYTFLVNRKGYLFYSELYSFAHRLSDSTYIKDIPLQPIELNSSLTFQNIQFETNSAKILPVSLIELNKLLQLLKENKTVQVQISGHTDNSGIENNNLILSTNRAKAVVQYLTDNGIAAARLQYKGYGSSKPIADNNTEEGRAKNRRTEFVITGL